MPRARAPGRVAPCSLISSSSIPSATVSSQALAPRSSCSSPSSSSFLAIRTSARLTRSVSWWPGGIETEGGVHIHHLVFGICLMLFCGFLAFAAPLDVALVAPGRHRLRRRRRLHARRVRPLGAARGRVLEQRGPRLVRRRRLQLRVRGARRDRHAAVRPRRADLDRRHGARRRRRRSASPAPASPRAACCSASSACSSRSSRSPARCGSRGPARRGRSGATTPRKTARAEARFADTRPLARANRRLGDLVAGAPGKEGA